jgi:hypothetical protein
MSTGEESAAVPVGDEAAAVGGAPGGFTLPVNPPGAIVCGTKVSVSRLLNEKDHVYLHDVGTEQTGGERIIVVAILHTAIRQVCLKFRRID